MGAESYHEQAIDIYQMFYPKSAQLKLQLLRRHPETPNRKLLAQRLRNRQQKVRLRALAMVRT